MLNTPLIELQNRISLFQMTLKANGISGALVAHNVDLYYFTGYARDAYFYIPASGEPVYLARYRAELPTDIPGKAHKFRHFKDIASILADYGYPGPGKLGLELDIIPVNLYQRIKEIFPERSFVDITLYIRQQRAIKTPWEIQMFQETDKKDMQVWKESLPYLRNCNFDTEISAVIEAQSRKHGHQGILRIRGLNQEMCLSCAITGDSGAEASTYDVPLSGAGSSRSFPFGASGERLVPGKPILVDYGGCYYGYVLDQTRMLAVNYMDNKALYAFETCLAIQHAIVAKFHPGITCGEIYELAASMARKTPLADGFMGASGGVPYVGHGVGLEVNELPALARGSGQVLKEGMVLAVEPKFALSGLGAVGIENCFLVTEAGLKRLTSFPDDIVIIEK